MTRPARARASSAKVSRATAGSKRFTQADQEAFAQLCGDRNPIHFDSLAARRTQAGAPVVHGVHGLLWALERLARAEDLTTLATLGARFTRFVYLDRAVGLNRRESPAEPLSAEILSDGLSVTAIVIGRRRSDDTAPAAGALDWAGLPSLEVGERPDEPDFKAMAGLGGWLAPPDSAALARKMFPALCAALGVEAVSGLALLSTAVGMCCPGRHSMFSHLKLERTPDRAARPGIGWRTALTDERVRWVALQVEGSGWRGEATALALQAPVAAPPLEAFCARIAPGEFAGRRALIIGGSRGLGAVTAKAIAAGGGRSIVTYVRGRAEAQAMAEEITAWRGSGACIARTCDVTGDIGAQLGDLAGTITHLYYFPTPQIARQGGGGFDRALLNEFLAVYVDGYAKAWSLLAGAGLVAAFYPSTVFIDKPSKGLTEYVMAKAAAEVLVADLARRARSVSVLAPRIPRVLTDQTATVPPVSAADALDVMLPYLRGQP